MTKLSFLRLFAHFVFILFANQILYAQSSNAEVYAIKGATIHPVTGAPITNGVVVIRNGLIEAVGANITIPADARVIDGAGLSVYPGLIDAYSNYGIRPPTPNAAPQSFAQQLAAPPSTVGMLPEVTVTDQLQITPETFDQQRNAGITAALTTPREGIFQGRSAFITLGNDAPDKLLLKSPVALNIQFVTARGGFPSSLMGTFAFLRQMLLDAQHYRDEWEWYNKSPRGKTRPAYNKSLEALIPIVNGTTPVIFNASTAREMKRAIALAEEFKLKYMLAGATQSYLIADLLKAKNVTILLSLSYPQKPMVIEDPEDESLRSIKERAEAPSAAAALQKAGVRFAFSSGTLSRPVDYLVNVNRAIEAGLSKDDALKALTIHPAQIFGVAEQVGSIEKGKIANLIVTTGDLFNKDTKIKFTFVDGKQYINKGADTPAGNGGRPNGTRPAAMASGAVAGTWDLTINSPAGTMNSPLSLQQNGEVIAGEIGTPAGKAPITGGKIKGDEVTFTYSINFQGQQLTIVSRGKINGNSMTGTMETMGQQFDFSGTRKPQAN